MKNLLNIITITLLLNGCGPARHGITTTVSTAGGALAGYELTDGSLEGAVIGGAAGAVVGETLNFLQDTSERKAFGRGYQKGRSDEVKVLYWARQDLHHKGGSEENLIRKYYQLPINSYTAVDGTKIENHTRVIEVVE